MESIRNLDTMIEVLQEDPRGDAGGGTAKAAKSGFGF